jgi:hypothetical protein
MLLAPLVSFEGVMRSRKTLRADGIDEKHLQIPDIFCIRRKNCKPLPGGFILSVSVCVTVTEYSAVWPLGLVHLKCVKVDLFWELFHELLHGTVSVRSYQSLSESSSIQLFTNPSGLYHVSM